MAAHDSPANAASGQLSKQDIAVTVARDSHFHWSMASGNRKKASRSATIVVTCVGTCSLTYVAIKCKKSVARSSLSLATCGERIACDRP